MRPAHSIRHNRVCDPAVGVRWTRQDVPKLEALLPYGHVGVSCAEVRQPVYGRHVSVLVCLTGLGPMLSLLALFRLVPVFCAGGGLLAS